MRNQNYSLSDFDYPLPESLIAQKPAEPRDHSRLLVYDRKRRTIIDDYFYNLPKFLPPGATLVANNSRVEKTRLLFGKKEVFITRMLGTKTVEAMIRPGKAFKKGRTVILSPVEGLSGTDENHSKKIEADVEDISDDGLRILTFNRPLSDPLFDPYRRTPFPPYIRARESLAEKYQTVYAKGEGSKAAPTAGLHFTNRLFEELSRHAISCVEITLHVGLGTFSPVKQERIQDHKMHVEWYSILPEAARMLSEASHITAVGTTSARVLETVVQKNQNAAFGDAFSDRRASVEGRKAGDGRSEGASSPMINPLTPPPDGGPRLSRRIFPHGEGETNIFITPGYRFQAIDSLITNFHLPKSTLLMMVAAFTGIKEMHRIYAHAIQKKYRFYSFGDAMLLL